MTVKELLKFIEKRIEIGDLDENGQVVIIDSKVTNIDDFMVDGKDLLLVKEIQ